MGRAQHQDDLLRQIADLRKRVNLLETARRLPYSDVGGQSVESAVQLAGLGEVAGATLIGPANALNSVTTYQEYDTYDVTVGPNGKLLIVLQALISLTATPGGSCRMAYKLSGANTLAASDDRSYLVNSFASFQETGTLIQLRTGLNAGATTVTTCFRTGASNIAQFESRYTFALPL